MPKFPIIFGIIGKKLYLTIIYTLIGIIYSILKSLIPEEESISIINKLGGSAIEMLSIFIPYIFKFKSKFEKSSRKCTKSNFKDYFLLFLIVLSYEGIAELIDHLDIKDYHSSNLWSFSINNIICNFVLTIIMLKAKYYIHNFISMILCFIFLVIIDLIFGNFKNIKPSAFIDLFLGLLGSLLFCYEKYLMDKKYHSYWNILFFIGLDYFIIYAIYFIVILIIDPNNNSIIRIIRKSQTKNIIINFFLDAILNEYLTMLLMLLILEYLSVNHELISKGLHLIVMSTINIIYDYNKHKNKLFFLIPAFFLIISILFYLEILEFNFCNLNKNTKRNIMLREEEEMLLRNNTNVSEIEIDKDLIVKNTEEKKDFELYDMTGNSEEKENDSEN